MFRILKDLLQKQIIVNYIEANSTIKSYFSGSRRVSNIFWATTVSLGGFGFFLTGLSSFFGKNLLLFSDSSGISFVPQGIVLLFYGTVGSILGIFLILTIYWNVGSGYNEYNRDLQKIKLYRQGFPGKNRELVFTFSFEEIKSIKMRIKEGINPKRQLLLCLIDSREIPLTGIDQQVALNKIENEAIEIAKYLNVFLETE
jgi:hypothetical protein